MSERVAACLPACLPDRLIDRLALEADGRTAWITDSQTFLHILLLLGAVVRLAALRCSIDQWRTRYVLLNQEEPYPVPYVCKWVRRRCSVDRPPHATND